MTHQLSISRRQQNENKAIINSFWHSYHTQTQVDKGGPFPRVELHETCVCLSRFAYDVPTEQIRMEWIVAERIFIWNRNR